MVSLSSFYFGRAAAENEVTDDPDRFFRTYYDHWGLLAKFENHDKFLVLGPKGAGKSAASRYLELTWKRRLGEHAVFANFVDFDDLNRTQTPLDSLDRKLVGDIPALTDAAWRLFIAVRLLDSLISDTACDLGQDFQLQRLMSDLRMAGLSSDDYPQVLRRVRERKGTIGIPKLFGGEAKSTQTDQVSIGQVGESLMRIILRASTPNRHLLAIDGLDKAIGDKPAYWQTLAALVRVADDIRRQLKPARSLSAHVLIMCRSDVFRRVRFSEAAKIAADGGVYMDWDAESQDPYDVKLWEYVCRKAEITRDELFRCLPTIVNVGNQGKVNIGRYLLQVTRYTPRDLTLLFNCLQDRDANKRRLTSGLVRRAADTFSSRHLLTEIMAEATGLLPEILLEKFERIMSALPSRVFTREDLHKALADVGVDSDTVGDLGEYLFLQGAIGNYRTNSGYVQFYHRRDAYKFDKRGPWILHTGLVYAFNIPWSTQSDNQSRRV